LERLVVEVELADIGELQAGHRGLMVDKVVAVEP
jgi:hypothetical protein